MCAFWVLLFVIDAPVPHIVHRSLTCVNTDEASMRSIRKNRKADSRFIYYSFIHIVSRTPVPLGGISTIGLAASMRLDFICVFATSSCDRIKMSRIALRSDKFAIDAPVPRP